MDTNDAEDWKELWSLDMPERVSLAVLREIEAYGIRVPRKLGQEGDSSKSDGDSCFGVSLSAEQKTLPYQYGASTFVLPRVFVEAVQFLKGSVDCEGIFRKSGSVIRQKNLRVTLESGGSLNTSNVHDVANLLKQYLRELPHSLLTPPLIPVFEACHELLPPGKDQRRAVLLTCLLLPTIHLQCLCVLLELLSSIAARVNDSFMDASSLAVVMSPNLTGPPQNILCPLNHSLKMHTAIVKLLIESSHFIGRVPPDIAKKRLLESHSLDSVVRGETGEDVGLPERYQKRRKRRTASISGLVLGIGNRLRSRTSGRIPSSPPPASPSQGRIPMENHPSISFKRKAVESSENKPTVSKSVNRRTSFKRKALEGRETTPTVNKRPALFHRAAPSPAGARPPRYTPLGNRKKRKSLLSNRRHTDQMKQHPNLPFSYHNFKPSNISGMKLDFANQAATKANRSPEWRSALQKFAQGNLVTPGVARATPTSVQLVGFAALHTPGQPCATNTGGGRGEGEQVKADFGSGTPDSLDSECTIETSTQSSSDGRMSSEATQRDLEEKLKVALPTEGSTELDLFGLNEVANEQESKYKSQLLNPGECTPLLPCTASEPSGDPGQQSDHDTEQQVPRVYAVAKRSSGKRMRCEVTEDTQQLQDEENSDVPQTLQRRTQSVYVFDSVFDGHPPFRSAAKPPLNIRTSRSDYQLNSRRKESGKSGVSTPARIPTSVSHPCFPLSLPHNRLEVHDLKGESSTDDQESDKSTHRITFTFSNPRPVNAEQRAAVNVEQRAAVNVEQRAAVNAEQRAAKSTDKCPVNAEQRAAKSTDKCRNEDNKLPECEKEFESSRKVSECNEANLLEARNSPMLSATPLQPCSRTTSSVHSGQDLDEAFLLTPYPGVCRSPNLLEKISLEIAARHNLFPCTPHPLVEASLHVNDSYKQAVLGESYPFPLPEPLSLRFETSDIAVKEENYSEEEDDCSDDCRALESDSGNCDTVNSHEDQRTSVHKNSSAKPQDFCDQHGNVTEAPRLQPRHPNLPPPPSFSDRNLKSRIVVTSKSHHKHEKHESHWFGTPSASRKSPWFRGHGPTGQRFSKRAHVYMVSSPTHPSDLSSHPPPHHHPAARRRSLSHRPTSNKENIGDSVKSGGVKACSPCVNRQGVQVKEWIV